MTLNSRLPLETTLQPLLKEGFIAFCGAGISIPPPSCSPSWWTLTEEILKAFFDIIPEDYGLPKDMILKDPERQPEEVFENFAVVLEERLYNAFEALNVAEPNLVHIIMAKLAKAGILKACFTTNFDIYFERALNKEGVDFELIVENVEYDKYYETVIKNQGVRKGKFLLCKIHGTIEKPNTIISVASAYKSSKGFSLPKAAIFEELLKEYPCLFMGYSGWDFNHLNYRRFWERVGPHVKKILWNQRPNEGQGPDFEEIFKTCFNVFEFTEAELPEGLIKALESLSHFNLSKFKAISKDNAEADYISAKNERIAYFSRWVSEFPNAHNLGLVMIESQNFSTRFREVQKKMKEDTEKTEAISYDYTEKYKELAELLNKGEISPEEYNQRVQVVGLEASMTGINNKYKPLISAIISDNKYPGITDDQSAVLTFISNLRRTTKWFDFEESIKLAVDYARKHHELAAKNTKEASAELRVLANTIILLHPIEQLWKPYAERMHKEKEQYLMGDIDDVEFSLRLGRIYNEGNKAQMGLTLDLEYLLEKQIKATVESKSDEELEDQAEAFIITMLQVGPQLYEKIQISEEYKFIVEAVKQEKIAEERRDPNIKVSKEALDAFYAVHRKQFIPVIERAGRSNKYISLLLELGVLNLMITGIRWLDSDSFTEYNKAWDAGEYPLHRSHPVICKYILDKVISWLDDALMIFPPRFIHRLCQNVCELASLGNDFELCKKVTLKSLELTEGLVTEATPDGIPGTLAAFYERTGDKTSALKYYSLCLDGIKLVFPPLWSDAIIYRAAKLTAELDDKRKALKIMGEFHPSFRGNASFLNMPGRKMTLDFAENLARELGYSDVNAAIEDIFA